MKTTHIAITLVVLITFLGCVWFLTRNEVHEPAENPNIPVSNEIDTLIRTRVTTFGARLKNVSLLQPKASLGPNMVTQYGTYVDPTLLRKWQENPSEALGRETSSPFPDRIEVLSVIEINKEAYRVEGNIIEIANANTPMEPVSIYPITLTLRLIENEWMITGVVKGMRSEIPQRVSVTGRLICLPHRDTTGPQTDECAFGLKLDDGTGNLAMNTALMSTAPVDFQTGKHVRVQGIMVPIEQLSTNTWQKYNIKGIISATTVTTIP